MIKDEHKNLRGRQASPRSAGKSRHGNSGDKSILGRSKQALYPIRLPGFITDEDEEIGLGDAIKRTTSYFGIKPCGGCERRAAALNRWLAFTPKRK
jgi:hypothetical protein